MSGIPGAFARNIPGSGPEMAEIMKPTVETFADRLRPPSGEFQRQAAILQGMGNPTVHVGNFRSTAADMIVQQMKKTHPDKDLIEWLQGYLKSSQDGWTHDQLVIEEHDLGNMLGSMRRPAKGATPSETVKGINREHQQQIEKLYGALMQDSEEGKMAITTPGLASTAGPTDPQAIARHQQWRRVSALHRREMAANGLQRMLDDSFRTVQGGDMAERINLSQVVNQMTKARRAASKDPQARLFVQSFTPSEYEDVIKTLKEMDRYLPTIPAKLGVTTVSSERFVSGALGSLIGAGIGELTGSVDVGMKLGAASGVLATRELSQAMMTPAGRATIRFAMKLDRSMGPTFQHILAGYLRSQMPGATAPEAPETTPTAAAPPAPKPLPTPPAVR